MREGGFRVAVLVIAIAIVGFAAVPPSDLDPIGSARADDPVCAGVDPQTGNITLNPENCHAP